MSSATIATAKLVLTVIVDEILATTLGTKERIFLKGTLERRGML